MRPRRTLIPAVATAFAAAAAIVASPVGAGSTPPDTGERTAATDVYETFNAMSGEERRAALVEAAEAEGAVTLYTANSHAEAQVAAFEELYDIEVDLYTAGDDEVLQRALQEADAGQHRADIYDDSQAGILWRMGLGHPYVNEELTAQIPDYDPSGGLVPKAILVFTVGWNTDAIDESELPDNIWEFTDPKWAGRLSMEDGDWDWYLGLSDYLTTVEGWTQDEVRELVSTLASQSRLASGHTTQAQLLVANEFDVALSLFTISVDREREQGAPIAWRKEDGSAIMPLIYAPQVSMLMRHAQHPAAALLYMDFLLSDGQEVVDDGWPVSELPGGTRATGEWDVFIDDLFLVDQEQYFDNREPWIEEYSELIGAG